MENAVLKELDEIRILLSNMQEHIDKANRENVYADRIKCEIEGKLFGLMNSLESL